MLTKQSNAVPIKETQKENILVLSLDFDGCIFNVDNYFKLDESDCERTIKANQLLLDHIVDEVRKGNYDRVVLMVGSNRQSYEIDQFNSEKDFDGKIHKTSSCYDAIEELRQALAKRINIPCELETYLLSDSYAGKSPGSNFKSYKNKSFNECNGFVWDSLKISLLYAQMHRVVTKYKNANVDFRFFDDKDEDILPALAKFYSENRLFVPQDLSLSLHCYDGVNLFKYYFSDGNVMEEGLGPKDTNLNINMATFAECFLADHYNFSVKSSYCFDNIKFDISEVLKNGNAQVVIRKFENNRLLDELGVCVELGYKINCLKKLYQDKEEFSELIELFNQLQMTLLANVELQKGQSEEEALLTRFALKLVREFNTSTKNKIFEEQIDSFIKKYENRPTLSLIPIVNLVDSSYRKAIANFGILGKQNPALDPPKKIARRIALALKNIQEFQKKPQKYSQP